MTFLDLKLHIQILIHGVPPRQITFAATPGVALKLHLNRATLKLLRSSYTLANPIVDAPYQSYFAVTPSIVCLGANSGCTP